MKIYGYGKLTSIFIQKIMAKMIYFERQKFNQIRNNYLAKSVKWDIEAWSGAILEMARISNEREDLSANLAFE